MKLEREKWHRKMINDGRSRRGGGDCGVATDCGREDRKICGAEREGSGPEAPEAVIAGGKSRGWKRHEGVYGGATVVGVCSVCALVNVSAKGGAVGALPSI